MFRCSQRFFGMCPIYRWLSDVTDQNFYLWRHYHRQWRLSFIWETCPFFARAQLDFWEGRFAREHRFIQALEICMWVVKYFLGLTWLRSRTFVRSQWPGLKVKSLPRSILGDRKERGSLSTENILKIISALLTWQV